MIPEKEHKKEKFITLMAKFAADVNIPGMSVSSIGKVPEIGKSNSAKPMTEPIDLDNKLETPEIKTNSSASANAFRSAANNPARGRTNPSPKPLRPQQVTHIPRPFSKIAYKRNTGIADSDGLPYTNIEDVALLAKLGYSVDKDMYLFLPRGEEKEDLYSYAEKVAGVSKDVARCIDQGTAFSSEHLKDMDYEVPEGYEIKGDLVAPIEKKAELVKQAIYDNIVIENPKGSKKEFGKNYPIPVMTYPVDYGYLPGYMAQDDADLDFFKGSDTSKGFHGSFDVWRPDVKGELETKFYTSANEEEKKAILEAFKKVIRGTPKEYDNAALLDAINSFKVKTAAADPSQTIPEGYEIKGDLVAPIEKKASMMGVLPKAVGSIGKHITPAAAKGSAIVKQFQPAGKIGFNNVFAPKPNPAALKNMSSSQIGDYQMFHELYQNKNLLHSMRNDATGHKPAFSFNVPNAEGVDELHHAFIHPNIINTAPGKYNNRLVGHTVIQNTATGKNVASPIYRSTGKSAANSAGVGGQYKATVDEWYPTRGWGMPSDEWMAARAKTPVGNAPIPAPPEGLKIDSFFKAPSGQDTPLGPDWIAKYQLHPETGEWLVHAKNSDGPDKLLPIWDRFNQSMQEYMRDYKGSLGISKQGEAQQIKQGTENKVKTAEDNYTLYRGTKEPLASADSNYYNLLRKALKNQLSERKDQKLLQELARRQRGFFTTDKTIAENYAGTDGHLYSLDLKDSDLSKIYGDYNNLGKANQALVLNVPHELANKARLVDKTAAADPAQTILITGHSGSGKSTLGKLLGKKAEATHELKSSNIRAVGYDKENKKLEVAFHSGGNYTYNDVPKSLFDRIRRVKSPGKFFHKHIKRDNSYSYERMGKESEYKFHWSKDLHRDVTNNRHYPFSFLTGEAQELVDAVKNRDWPNFKEEIGDTTYAAQMLAAQATGLNHPVYADLSKHYGREKVWKDMFREKGSTYHPKHMEGGSNYAKASKIIKAFASAGIKVDQREAERLANKYTGGKMEKEAGSKIIPPHIRDLMIRRSQGDLTALEALRNIGRANAAKRARLKPINDLINRTSEPVVVQPKPIAPVVPMEEPVRLDPEVIRARFDEMRRALGNPGQNQ